MRDNNIAIKAEDVSMMFNLSREREERLKEYVINLVRGKLFFDEFWASEISMSGWSGFRSLAIIRFRSLRQNMGEELWEAQAYRLYARSFRGRQP